jgi:hypothetical protein
MAMASPSAPELPPSEHLSFDGVYKQLNIIAIPPYPSFNSWSNAHGDVEEKAKKSIGEGGPRLYCQIGQGFAEDLANKVTQFTMQGRTYWEFQDLLNNTLFLPGNSDPTTGRTAQTEIRSRIQVTSNNVAKRHDLTKDFLLPPVVIANVPSSHKSLSAAESKPIRNTDPSLVVKARRRFEEFPKHCKAQTSEAGARQRSKISHPVPARLPEVESHSPLTFPDGNYDTSYWLNTKHDLFPQGGISDQTFVLLSHHTSPYLTIVCPDFRPTEEKEIEDCARSLYSSLLSRAAQHSILGISCENLP